MQRRFDNLREAYQAERYPAYEMRLSRLKRLEKLLEDHQDALAEAISRDFGHRSRHETLVAEVLVCLAAIRHMRRHLRAWMRPRKVATAAHFWPARNRLLLQPLGVVGVVSPWNYPVQLALVPVAAAMAAGNRVMLKPSELTPATSGLLASLLASAFTSRELTVVEGDAGVGKSFVELPFDHLLFTGSTAVGRSVALAAARNLTPVTLELGGKSPAIIDPSARLEDVIESLMFGKLLNAGQTCIAPDYVLLPRGRETEFKALAAATVARFYPDIDNSEDYSNLISARHVSRIDALVEAARLRGAEVVTLAGARAPATPSTPASGSRPLPSRVNRMAPRLVLGAHADMMLMQEEIFGPVLPVVSYDTLEEAIGYVNAHDRPLALYWYGRDHAHRDQVLRDTVSGGATVNDTLWHLSQEDQPFGGVGASGQGAYHGETGFRTFSHEKAVFYQSRLNGAHLLYPPYGARFNQLLSILRRIV